MSADKSQRQVMVNMKFSLFSVPPCSDALIIGKSAPIGCQAAMQMLTAIAPGRFELIEVNHSVIEGIAIRKDILKMIGRENVMPLICQEVSSLMDERGLMYCELEVISMQSKSFKVNDGPT